ncbi:hypothetical protein ACWET9_43230 [Streptomyces sp. NPDC004059]
MITFKAIMFHGHKFLCPSSGLLAALTDHRHGTRHPKTVHPAGGTLQG